MKKDLQWTNLFSLEGKIILITGATGVLGGEMARALGECGAQIILLGRDKNKAQQIANDITSKGGTAKWFVADVLDRPALEDIFQQVIQEFGRIDILINGVGGNLPKATQKPGQSFFDVDTEAFQKVNELNLMGAVLPSQIFGRSFKDQKKGIIINISSVSAQKTLSRVGGYGAAKAGVSHFTQWLAVDMARNFGEGIRVNAIMPGFFLTEQNKSLLTNTDGSLTDRGKNIIQQVPFGRFGQPDELIGTLIWLCSDASAFVTGTVIPVDGGFIANGGI